MLCLLFNQEKKSQRGLERLLMCEAKFGRAMTFKVFPCFLWSEQR